ncbi:unnamed protein product [Closterium sp. Naga37s-1]|nr:unnamed protein product [Closterium sp. Naga37s-1]
MPRVGPLTSTCPVVKDWTWEVQCGRNILVVILHVPMLPMFSPPPSRQGPLESDLLLTAAAARTSLPEWATTMQQQRQQRQQWRQHEQQKEGAVMGSSPLFHSSSSSNGNSSYQHRVLQQTTGDTSFAEKNQGMVVLQLLSAGAFQYGRFYSPLFIGSPPRMYVALVDTAVSLSWLYCDCIKCPQDSPVIKERTFYTTLNSTSAALLNCTSPACLQLPAAGCSALPRNLSRSNSSCDLRYAPAGDLVQDGMLLKVVKGGAASEQAARINFGCGRMDVGYGGSSVDGVLALGSRPYGLLAQLNASLGLARAYSLCFDGGNQRGALLMGDADAPPGMVTTRLRLLPNVSRPFLAVQSMRMGSSAVGNSSDLAALVNGTQGGFTVDTAVLYSGFHRLVFNTMVNMLFADPSLTRTGSEDKACVVNDEAAKKVYFPPILIDFAEGSLTVLPQNYMVVNETAQCFAAVPLDANATQSAFLGTMWIRDQFLTFDYTRNIFSFQSMNCTTLTPITAPPPPPPLVFTVPEPRSKGAWGGEKEGRWGPLALVTRSPRSRPLLFVAHASNRRSLPFAALPSARHPPFRASPCSSLYLSPVALPSVRRSTCYASPSHPIVAPVALPSDRRSRRPPFRPSPSLPPVALPSARRPPFRPSPSLPRVAHPSARRPPFRPSLSHPPVALPSARHPSARRPPFRPSSTLPPVANPSARRSLSRPSLSLPHAALPSARSLPFVPTPCLSLVPSQSPSSSLPVALAIPPVSLPIAHTCHLSLLPPIHFPASPHPFPASPHPPPCFPSSPSLLPMSPSLLPPIPFPPPPHPLPCFTPSPSLLPPIPFPASPCPLPCFPPPPSLLSPIPFPASPHPLPCFPPSPSLLPPIPFPASPCPLPCLPPSPSLLPPIPFPASPCPLPCFPPSPSLLPHGPFPASPHPLPCFPMSPSLLAPIPFPASPHPLPCFPPSPSLLPPIPFPAPPCPLPCFPPSPSLLSPIPFPASPCPLPCFPPSPSLLPPIPFPASPIPFPASPCPLPCLPPSPSLLPPCSLPCFQRGGEGWMDERWGDEGWGDEGRGDEGWGDESVGCGVAGGRGVARRGESPFSLEGRERGRREGGSVSSDGWVCAYMP